jgi:hypothetical protein
MNQRDRPLDDCPTPEIMKRSQLATLVLWVSTLVSMGTLTTQAQTPGQPNSPSSTSRPISSAELSDRVVITPQTASLMRGKPGDEYPGDKVAKIQYPKISGIKDAIVLAKVQAAVSLKTIMGQSLEELRTELQESYWLTNIDYVVNYNQNFLLDLTYTIEGVGAYPSQYEKHVTVDLKTGKKLRSHHLFKREFLGAIAVKVDKMMQAEIANKIASLDPEDEPIRSRLSQVRFRVHQVDNFTLSDTGVTFRYDFDFPHVVKAAEPGGRYFFTYAQLKSYIRQDGPLGKLIQ